MSVITSLTAGISVGLSFQTAFISRRQILHIQISQAGK
jgi:hypothetical protein